MFKTLLKFGFASAILVWLVKRGDLDFSLIGTSLTEHPLRVTFCILLILFAAIGTSFRWKMLLEVKSQDKLPHKKLIGLTWIGLFFSSILPGAVTGDVFKVVYAKNLDSKLTKTFLFISALMDRTIGLLGLLFLLGIFSILHYHELTTLGPGMEKLLYINFLFMFGAVIFFITLFLPTKIQDFFLRQVDPVWRVGW